jgi:hypothetical protein
MRLYFKHKQLLNVGSFLCCTVHGGERWVCIIYSTRMPDTSQQMKPFPSYIFCYCIVDWNSSEMITGYQGDFITKCWYKHILMGWYKQLLMMYCYMVVLSTPSPHLGHSWRMTSTYTMLICMGIPSFNEIK